MLYMERDPHFSLAARTSIPEQEEDWLARLAYPQVMLSPKISI